MAGYRKLARTASQRKALLRSQVTALLYHGKIVTTEAKAKEIRKIAEKLIAMAVREQNNFETVTVTAKVARKDADGKNVKEVKDGKKVTVYDEVQKEIKKDKPSRLHARKEMNKILYSVTEVPEKIQGRKRNTKNWHCTLSMCAVWTVIILLRKKRRPDGLSGEVIHRTRNMSRTMPR